MSQARTEILNKIRQALGRGALEPSAVEALNQRMADPPINLQPQLRQVPIEHFTNKLSAVAGTVAKVRSLQDVPQAVLGFLQENSLPLQIVMASDAPLARLSWPAELSWERRAAHKADQTSLTGAFAGVAETGSVVLLSGPRSPTTLNFLPENHIVVLQAGQIVLHIEDVWARLRAQGKDMPRTVNFITGPSRTADVEQTIQLGAHGPRRLHVVLVLES